MRARTYGRNELEAEKPVPRWKKFLAQFQNVLVILLLVATAISAGLWLYEQDSSWPYEATAIFAVVLLNAMMGYIQESRAEEAVAALRQMSAAHADVVREGNQRSIPAAEVVPGDIYRCRRGRHHSRRRTANPVGSTANGGSRAHRRKPACIERHVVIEEEAELGDRHDMIFSGTAVTFGRGHAVVVATGMQTQMGRIAGLLEESRRNNPAAKELARIGKLLGIIVDCYCSHHDCDNHNCRACDRPCRHLSMCSFSGWRWLSLQYLKAWRRS